METIAKKKKKRLIRFFTICRVRVSVRHIGKIGPLGFVVLVSMCLVRGTADKTRLQKAHTMETEHSSYSLSEMSLLLAYLLPTDLSERLIFRTENRTHGNDKWYMYINSMVHNFLPTAFVRRAF